MSPSLDAVSFALAAGAAVTPEALPPWLRFFTFASINVWYVFLGCTILGVSAGMIGCFAFLRRRSLLGDALSHAALPGVCVAFLLTHTKEPLLILGGAAVSCWLGALSVDAIVRYTRCKEDSALGMVLSVFYGVGILMLTHIQNTGVAAQAGLDTFLFGQAAAMIGRDVWTFSILAVLLCLVVLVGYKEFKVVSFDPGFAQSIGVRTRLVEVVLATLIVLAVAIGLQAVGVVLMAAMLVTPAAAARYWTERLSVMLVLAACFGGLSGAIGAYLSYLQPGMPTGPWMVVAVSTMFIVSLIAAPQRGVAGRLWRHARFRRRTQQENVLRTLYKFGERLQKWDEAHATGDLLQHRHMSPRRLRAVLLQLEHQGLTQETSQGLYQLTEAGRARAARLTRLHRLWELYLTSKLEIAPDHVHDDAEEIEHVLTPDLERRLLDLLEHPQEDPHGSSIPVPGAGNGEGRETA